MSEGYAVIPRALFNQPWFQGLSDRACRLALYAAAGPHSNIVGAYLLPDGYIAADLEWSIETVRETISELIDAGFVKRFGDGRFILLCRHPEWNTIANPNVMKAALKQLQSLPGDPALSLVFDWLRPLAKRFQKGLPTSLETVRKRLGVPLANTEAEAEASIESLSESKSKGGKEQKSDAEIATENVLVGLQDACGANYAKVVDAAGGMLKMLPFVGSHVRLGCPNVLIAANPERRDAIMRDAIRAVRIGLGADVLVECSDWQSGGVT